MLQPPVRSTPATFRQLETTQLGIPTQALARSLFQEVTATDLDAATITQHG